MSDIAIFISVAGLIGSEKIVLLTELKYVGNYISVAGLIGSEKIGSCEFGSVSESSLISVAGLIGSEKIVR